MPKAVAGSSSALVPVTGPGSPARTRARSVRVRLLTHDFRVHPRARREDREILLFARVQALNEQETAGGDAECGRVGVRRLAVGRLRAGEIASASPDPQPLGRARA